MTGPLTRKAVEGKGTWQGWCGAVGEVVTGVDREHGCVDGSPP
jgi:hypothetical protein